MKLGFIGCGNMAKAIMGGIISSNIVTPSNIYGSDAVAAATQTAAETLGITACTKNGEVVQAADIVFLCVKPYQYEAVITEIRNEVTEDKLVVTIAPGKTIAWIEEQFAKPLRLIRTMPNTPALVGEGITAYCPNSLATAEDVAYVRSLLESFGKAIELKENLVDVTSAVGGSSPAYVYMFIEAMADAGVAEGLPRAQAYEIAAQSVMGSAKMVLETGKHPGQLKDEVTSPSGSTIKGLEVLENGSFRGTVMSALRCAIAAARSL